MDRRNKPSALAATPAAPPQARVDLVGDRVTAVLPTGESVEVLLTGATVLSWKGAVGGGAAEERLWLSESAVLDGSKAVRGGIPIVFPVFGQSPADVATAKLPQHGLARTSRWEFLGRSTSESDVSSKATSNGVQLDFGLTASSADTALKALWPFDFALLYRVALEPGSLTTSIVVTNNEAEKAFDFQVLLHTYFRVNDITQVQVDGLGGAPYSDKVDGFKVKTQAEGKVEITGETDRVYKPAGGAAQALTIVEGGKPKYGIARDNLSDAVVWNPWSDKTKSIGDFAPKDGYKNMLCVEPGSVSGWQTLEPGDAFEGAQSITLL
ncbi:hypothetical protein SEUCBS139899_007266 [Sporothrix eucalyptigena]|uniref:Glucose-6-phosphate 1-epimerase n=1 Tax=Sporothrix eucalyptigena TaxID=1812306 RepID=A0ABP0B6M4_9PEZI